jgi:excisionase family DNA binding protein
MTYDVGQKRRLLTVPEVAERLGVSRDWAYQMATAGALPVLRLGQRPGRGQVLRVRPEDLDEWLAQRAEVDDETEDPRPAA